MSQNNHHNSRKFKIHFSKKSISVIALGLVIIATGIFDLSYKEKQKKPVVIAEVAPIRMVPSGEIEHGDMSKKQVIFTFDAGAGLQSAKKILEVLARHHVKGTFFMTGKFVEANPDFVRKVVTAGHEIFNHTYDHPHLPTLTDAEIVTELDKVNASLASVVGSTSMISTRPFFRAPYGDRDERVMNVALKNGYHGVYWTVDAHDWEESTGVTPAEVVGRIISNLKSGNIYLMHVGDNITGDVLDQVFTEIEAKGYKIVSLTQGI